MTDLLKKPVEGFRAGFCAICGKPNVGKSTLLNRIIGTKLAITSNKPQTTRDQIAGIYTSEKVQIIFQDTPGIHIPKYKLQDVMTQYIDFTLKNTELILFMLEVFNNDAYLDEVALEKIKDIKKKKILVFNKIDITPNRDVKEIYNEHLSDYHFDEVLGVSAKDGTGIEHLLEVITSYLPESEMLFDPEEIALKPMRFFMAEIVREKIFHITEKELPYATAVEVITYKDLPNKIVIDANIIVERESQKKIIIGNGGAMISKIRKAAESEAYRFTGRRVQFHLFVKIRKDWRKKDNFLKDYGYTKLK